MSVDLGRGCQAVGVTSWIRTMTVGTHSFVGATVPILSLVSICLVAAVRTAGYLCIEGSVAVALAA